MTKSPVNFRAFGVVALAVAGAVGCGYAYMNIHAVGIILFCVYIAALGAAVCIFSVKFYRKECALRVLLAVTIAAAMSLCSFCIAVFTSNSWEKNEEFSGRAEVSGRVAFIDVRSGSCKLDLEDLVIDGKEASGKLRLNVPSDDKNFAENVKVGDGLNFTAKITASKLVNDGRVNGSAYRSDIRYRASDPSNVKITFGSPTVLERFTGWLQRVMTENMGEKYGNIAFSMITGDKHALDSDVSEYFSAAGIGHILAVSGLHVGFMALIINLVLAKAGKRTRYIVTLVTLALYCVLASFSPSVVRATIMTYVAMTAPFVGGRRDLLSSLCCAFSLILCFKPIYMFESGFLLSFGAIFGIAMFAGSVRRALTERKIPYKIGDAIGASTSVQAGIIPAQIYFFAEIRPLAILINLVVIPYITVVFIALVACTVVAAVPVFAPVLTVCKYLLIPVDELAGFVAAVPHSAIYVKPSAAVFLCYPAMFCAGEYYMMPRGKLAVVLASAAVCVFFCFVGAF